ncbi:Gp37-like protein [Glaciibacter psychrotolerans]|uniref:Microcystin-dependent protein n=1 Tax=Glaciibacter psychrotolerans TaxID=670054 RepID=A0A7Z0J594_9MICO|nr:tail fiber protein [Leifsonia psychrotolerans]NYJ19207.1 microcystin-dependent protein [Leifsonia psychrotolerans]
MYADDFTVEVRDRALVRLGQVSQADMTDVLVVPRLNTLGSWSLSLPHSVLRDGVEVLHPECALLRAPGSGIIISGPSGVLLSGPMTDATHDASTEDPGGTWTIVGVSDDVIVADAEAWPQPSNGDRSTQTVANDNRSGAAETVMHAYVNANIGPSAPAARRGAFASKLLMGANGARGGTVKKSPRFQNMLELLGEIAIGQRLRFGVFQNGAALEFRTTATADVSAYVRWDIDNGNVSSTKYAYSAPGVTDVTVAGQGEGTKRRILRRQSAASIAAETAWGRRIERFVDQRQTDDSAELLAAADELLSEEGDTVRSVQVVPSADMAEGFGTEWDLGSIVTIVVGDVETVAAVTEVPISITSDGVMVGATVGDPSGFDWESILAAKVSKTDSRVSALERNAEASTASPFPVGTSIEGYWSAPPVGFLIEDGAAVSRTSYADLFALIGTTYGVGNGSTTFNLPNHNGRVGVGYDGGQTEFNAMGKTGGAKTHQLTAAEMPSHAHGITAYFEGTTGGLQTVRRSDNASGSGTPLTTTSAGNNAAHNNLQPYITKRFAIKF